MAAGNNKVFAVLLLVGALTTGVLAAPACTTVTTFITKPAGAKIHVNGDYIGKSPCAFNDKVGDARRFRIQIIKEGHRSYNFFIDTEFIPFYGHSLADRYSFTLEPLPAGREPKAPASPEEPP